MASIKQVSRSIVIAIPLLCILFSGANGKGLAVHRNGTYAIELGELVDKLPSPFSNDKLPNSVVPTNAKCYDYVGCIELMPEFVGPSKPDKMGFEVRVLRNNNLEMMKYKLTKHCEKNNPSKCQVYPFNLVELKKLNFDPKKNSVLVIGGFLTQGFEKWQEEILRTWSRLGAENKIAIGWSGGNRIPYFNAVANTRVVARQISVFLYYLAQVHDVDIKNADFNDNFHLIGHSLGAHISGFVGKDLKGMLGRITGLDPAGPRFTNVDKRFRLDRSDAQLVDTLHTNGGSIIPIRYGLEKPIGHLDFYANNGVHQPSCWSAFDTTGCSHNNAHDLLISFLQHEAYLLDKIGTDKLDYVLKNRAFAYRSDNYEQFSDGSSFSKNCPMSSLEDYNINFDDLEKCTAPMDYIARPQKIRDELSTKYNISFDPNGTKNNKFYFFTTDAKPFLNHHNMIRVRVTKPKDDKIYKCNLNFVITMANGIKSSHKVKGYQLVDQGSHYEVVLPFVSPDSESRYALSDLDINDFYLNDHSKLFEAVETVLPIKVTVEGLVLGSELSEEEEAIISSYDENYGIDSTDLDELGWGNKCSLNVESVKVRPIKRLHRYFSAIYTTAARDFEQPKLKLLSNDQSKASEVEPDIAWGPKNSDVYIDTVVIGQKK